MKDLMKDLKTLLIDARCEIDGLRRENEILRAKVETMDLFACVLFTKAAEKLQTAAPDVAYALSEEIQRLEQGPAPPKKCGNEFD